MRKIQGDAEAFDSNWRNRAETGYLHWTRAEPANQIQLAFRRHWITFQDLINGRVGKRRSLEVGCGRGSMSAYFADDGWDCTLLDLSVTAIERAKRAFADSNLHADFDVGDCLSLPYADSSFDITFSIGLLEHFENIEKVISEQIRVLSSGGLFIGYVVPYLPDNVQKNYEWINNLLRALSPIETTQAAVGKTEIYRSDMLSPIYLEVMKNIGLVEIGHDGVYPLPMISHSVAFPFSLLPDAAEGGLVNTFQQWLNEREKITGIDPWRCPEGEGQAFLVWGRKP